MPCRVIWLDFILPVPLKLPFVLVCHYFGTKTLEKAYF